MKKTHNSPLNKHLYFRKTSSALSDDDKENGSVCFPVSSFRGARYGGSSSTVTLSFASIYNHTMDWDDNNVKLDSVKLNIATNGHVEFMRCLAEEIAIGKDGLIIVSDAVTGEHMCNVTGIDTVTIDTTENQL